MDSVIQTVSQGVEQCKTYADAVANNVALSMQAKFDIVHGEVQRISAMYEDINTRAATEFRTHKDKSAELETKLAVIEQRLGEVHNALSTLQQLVKVAATHKVQLDENVTGLIESAVSAQAQQTLRTQEILLRKTKECNLRLYASGQELTIQSVENAIFTADHYGFGRAVSALKGPFKQRTGESVVLYIIQFVNKEARDAVFRNSGYYFTELGWSLKADLTPQQRQFCGEITEADALLKAHGWHTSRPKGHILYVQTIDGENVQVSGLEHARFLCEYNSGQGDAMLVDVAATEQEVSPQAPPAPAAMGSARRSPSPVRPAPQPAHDDGEDGLLPTIIDTVPAVNAQGTNSPLNRQSYSQATSLRPLRQALHGASGTTPTRSRGLGQHDTRHHQPLQPSPSALQTATLTRAAHGDFFGGRGGRGRGGRGRGGRGDDAAGGRGRGRIPTEGGHPPFRQATKYQGLGPSPSSAFTFQPVTLRPAAGNVVRDAGGSSSGTTPQQPPAPQVSPQPGPGGSC